MRERGGGGGRGREIITLTAGRAKRIFLPERSLQWQRSKFWKTSMRSQRQTTESLISFLSTLVRRRAHDRLSSVRKDRWNCPWSKPQLLARTLASPPLPLQTLSRAGSRKARSARCKQQRWLKREVFSFISPIGNGLPSAKTSLRVKMCGS